MRAVILFSSVLIALLIATYFVVNVYFCSGALNGDFGGCLSMAGANLAQSTTVQIASLLCATGAFVALRRRRR